MYSRWNTRCIYGTLELRVGFIKEIGLFLATKTNAHSIARRQSLKMMFLVTLFSLMLFCCIQEAAAGVVIWTIDVCHECTNEAEIITCKMTVRERVWLKVVCQARQLVTGQGMTVILIDGDGIDLVNLGRRTVDCSAFKRATLNRNRCEANTTMSTTTAKV